jgi:hypothetical protein
MNTWYWLTVGSISPLAWVVLAVAYFLFMAWVLSATAVTLHGWRRND